MEHKKLSSFAFSLLQILILTSCFCPCSSDSNSIGCNATIPTPNKAQFRGMFVFGSSSVDNGNNNYLLNNTIKANYTPYGIDFKPLGATGRFTNNRTFADHIGELLKLPLVPPFADPLTKGASISHGVNYASAGSGVLDATNSNKERSSLNQQIENFMNKTLPNLQAQQQGCLKKDWLRNYLFLFSTGTNDFVDNYFQGQSRVGFEFFVSNMTSTLATQLAKLYNVGARKFAFLNLGALGCTPTARGHVPTKECYGPLNYVSYTFNTELDQMLKTLKPKLPGFQFVTVNFFQIALELMEYPSRGGFKNVSGSCCEVTKESDGILCKGGGSVCTNRSSYIYFDGFHPTDAFNGILATRAFNSNDETEVFPFNIQKLAQV